MQFLTGRNVFAVVTFAAVLVTLPRSSQAQFMGKAGAFTVKLTIPAGVTKMRGLLAFTGTGLGPGMASGADFQALAKRLSVGIINVGGGNEFGDASYPTRCAKGEFKGLLDAIADVAKTSNHPEITNAPIAGHGHSHGGDFWNWFNACYPERMALIFCKSSGGVQYSKGALKTPMVWEIGTNDLKSSDGDFRGNMLSHRDLGTQMALVLGPGESHGGFTQGSRAMVIDLIEGIYNLRVPAEIDTSAGPVTLFDIDEKGGGYWLGDDYTKEIAPWAMFANKDPLSKTSFLPNEEIAKKWKAYGAPLPASIMLEKGRCTGCYKTPADEPEAKPNNAGPPSGTAPSDAGAPTPGPSNGSDAAAAPTPIEPLPMPAMDAGAPPSTSLPPMMSAPPAAPPAMSPPKPPADDTVAEVGPTIGCAMATGAGGSCAGLVLLGLFGLVAYRRRR